jgi:hypothetical protein
MITAAPEANASAATQSKGLSEASVTSRPFSCVRGMNALGRQRVPFVRTPM